MKSVFKLTWRTIRTFFGRYMALLLIVALSAGFFAGLKITQDAMTNTGDSYLAEQNFYDFRMLSTLGFTETDVENFSSLSGVRTAEGTYTVDALIDCDGNNRAFKLMAVTDEVNLPSLTYGRMPQSANECLADDELFSEDDIGTVLRISDENSVSVTDMLDVTAYEIVGLADSPFYLNVDRGTTDIGSGALYSFIYIPEESFAGGAYTEVSLTLSETAPIYSEEYDAIIEKYEPKVTKLCESLAEERYQILLSDNGLTAETAELGGIVPADTYVLTRDENAGYLSFENDTSIISAVANIFPVFFILIAMLVCVTTMTRMVDEERTQIGVLKAMGFSNGTVMAKYLLYAGSATVIGWALGFFLCTWGLPLIFWSAYGVLYEFAPLEYLFSPSLAALTLIISLVCILGSTFISCRKELASVPARLIRPRAAKSGKRVLLERITPLWSRLGFLQKITLRNMFRYKQRLVMMLLGIGCCAGLVVTAFGVRDSMINIGSLQFEGVQNYDIDVTFKDGTEAEVKKGLKGLRSIDSFITAAQHKVDMFGIDSSMKSVGLICFEDTEDVGDFWDFHDGDQTLGYPKSGEVLINNRLAEKLDVSVGDSIKMRDSELNVHTVTVSGIFDNYIYNYAVLSEATYTEFFGDWQANTAMLKVSGDTEATAEQLTDMSEITSVSRLDLTKANIDNALSCLNYIIWLIVLFSGALAFIVIFNLTNINLAERSREIATVQVLGFYPKETESYVLRENLVLSVIAGFIGLPLGTLFHRIVMSMVVIDTFAFDVNITPISYICAFICTVLFAVIVDIFMKRQIGKIKMAESLKAVE